MQVEGPLHNTIMIEAVRALNTAALKGWYLAALTVETKGLP